jgi:hypothetical protein
MTMDERYRKEPADLSDADLVEFVLGRHTADPVPPCRLCGGPLLLGSFGSGKAPVWSCDGKEPDPDAPGRLRWKAGRRPADNHYSASQWTQYRTGDEWVLELVDRYRRLTSGETVQDGAG